MAAFDLLVPTAGNDTFSDLYTKHNDTMTALKAGTSSQVLTGTGVATAPVMTSYWDTFVVVGAGGGAPAYQANFVAAGGASDTLRYRKSLISDTVEVCGRFERATLTLTDTNVGLIFILPAGYRPTRPVICVVRNEINFKPLLATIDPSTGEVYLANGTGVTMTVGTYFDITFRFPIS